MEDSAFDALFDLAALRGPLRLPLLEKDQVKLAANLARRNKPRWADLLIRLSGWGGLTQFKREVNKFLGESDNKKAKLKAQEEAEARLAEAEERGMPFVAIGKPVKVAEDFRASVKPHLIFTDDTWLEWEVNSYRVHEKQAVRTALQEWMARGVDSETGEVVHPNKRDLDDTMDALRSVCFRSQREAAPPVWFDEWEDVDPNPKLTLAATNGLVDLETLNVYPNTPRYFSRNGLDYAYDHDAPEPVQWNAFLESLWPTHAAMTPELAAAHLQNKLTLQEIMGHLLTGETKYQKVFLFVGAPRSGKGTIARVIARMVGLDNVVEQSANKLGKEFGLKALLGKQVMIVPDLRLGRESNTSSIAEVILNISGEDRISVGRKFQDDWSGRLNTRLLLISNMGVAFPDQSGAISARLVPLVFNRSFAANPDTTLESKLLAELPSILNWAIAGLKRLEARRTPAGMHEGFVIPPGGRKLLTDIGRQSSAVRAFVTECCVVETGKSYSKAKLFEAFEGWCEESDIISHYTEEGFTRELKPASGYVVEVGLGPGREPLYQGIQLQEELEDYTWGASATE